MFSSHSCWVGKLRNLACLQTVFQISDKLIAAALNPETKDSQLLSRVFLQLLTNPSECYQVCFRSQVQGRRLESVCTVGHFSALPPLCYALPVWNPNSCSSQGARTFPKQSLEAHLLNMCCSSRIRSNWGTFWWVTRKPQSAGAIKWVNVGTATSKVLLGAGFWNVCSFLCVNQ